MTWTSFGLESQVKRNLFQCEVNRGSKGSRSAAMEAIEAHVVSSARKNKTRATLKILKLL